MSSRRRFALLAAFAMTVGLLLGQAMSIQDIRDRMRSWIDERVMLLGNPTDYPEGKPYKDFGGDLSTGGGPCYHAYGKPKAGLPNADYSGKTGVITGLADGKLVIQLDSGEKIEACSQEFLGFFSEMDAARKLVSELAGKPLWVRGGSLALLQPGVALGLQTPPREIPPVANLTRVEMERAVWGSPGRPIMIYFRTEDRREGMLAFGVDPAIIERLHYESRDRKPRAWVLEEYFFRQDPKAQHPGWPPEVWELVGKGEVAIGMSEEMVKASCGRSLEMRGLVLMGSQGSGRIYRCHKWQFLVEKGKVTKYVE